MTSATTTLAPSEAKSIAATLPIPLAAPVMSATLPSSLPIPTPRPTNASPSAGVVLAPVQLEDPLCSEPPEVPLAQVGERVSIQPRDQRRGVGHEHLLTAGELGDPGGSEDRSAEIPMLLGDHLAGLHPHPNPDHRSVVGALVERTLQRRG